MQQLDIKNTALVKSDPTSISKQLLKEKIRGRSVQSLAARYGMDEKAVEDMVAYAIDQSLANEDHSPAIAGVISRLIDVDEKLSDLYDETPTMGVKKFQALDTKGRIKDLVEDVNFVAVKRSILTERRQNALALKVVLGANTGEQQDDNRKKDIDNIKGAIEAAGNVVFDKIFDKVIEVAEENGQLKAAKVENFIDVKIEPEVKENDTEPKDGKMQ
jgi:hypothetical protein